MPGRRRKKKRLTEKQRRRWRRKLEGLSPGERRLLTPPTRRPRAAEKVRGREMPPTAGIRLEPRPGETGEQFVKRFMRERGGKPRKK